MRTAGVTPISRIDWLSAVDEMPSVYGHLDQLAAPLGQHLDDPLARRCLHARHPVVAVDHVVGPVAPQVRLVVERLLRHDARDALDVLDDDLPLLVRHVRQPLVARDGRVGQQADVTSPSSRARAMMLRWPGWTRSALMPT